MGVELSNISFGWTDTPLLSINRLTIPRGSSLFIHGESGSGKTTLLSLIAGFTVCHSGSIQVGGVTVSDLNNRQLDRYRADHIGFIFQQFNLIPYLTAAENILLTCRFSKSRMQKAGGKAEAHNTCQHLLRTFGLDPQEISGRFPGQLSVGQQQRVAAARALIGDPGLIITDEPTSSLDNTNAERFINLLCQQSEKTGATLLTVSHDLRYLSRFDQVINISELKT